MRCAPWQKMNTYDRIFGAGPRGALISFALLIVTWYLEDIVRLPTISESLLIRGLFFVLTIIASIILIAWSVKSLPPNSRGKELVTSGAYKYFRHPLYAAFLSCFNFGLAVFLNNWIYVIWAVILHVVWHWIVRSEEKLMIREFSKEYMEYTKRTGRFVPKIRNLQNSELIGS